MFKFSNQEKVPNDLIITEFQKSDCVMFSAKRVNSLPIRFMAIGELGYWFPLLRVCAILGFTPEVIRPVFDPRLKLVNRTFPLNLPWFGLNRNTLKYKEVNCPPAVSDYYQLGSFILSPKPFKKMAAIMNKDVMVYLHDSRANRHIYLYTVAICGRVEKKSP